MKKTKYGIISFFCMLTMVLVLVGCGSGPSDEKVKTVKDKLSKLEKMQTDLAAKCKELGYDEQSEMGGAISSIADVVKQASAIDLKDMSEEEIDQFEEELDTAMSSLEGTKDTLESMGNLLSPEGDADAGATSVAE